MAKKRQRIRLLIVANTQRRPARTTTNAPASEKTIGWVKTYGNAKVFFMQPGHGPAVYKNPTCRAFVVRAIRWTAG